MGLDPTSQLSTRSTSLLQRSSPSSGSDSDSGSGSSSASAPSAVNSMSSNSVSSSSSWASTYDAEAGNGRGWPRSGVSPAIERPASITGQTSGASALPALDGSHPGLGASSIIPLSFVANTITSPPTVSKDSPASKPPTETSPAHVESRVSERAAAAVPDIPKASSPEGESASGSNGMEGQRLHSITPYEDQIEPAAVGRTPPVPVLVVQEEEAAAPAAATTVVPRVVVSVPSSVRGAAAATADAPDTLGGFPLSQFMRKPKRRS